MSSVMRVRAPQGCLVYRTTALFLQFILLVSFLHPDWYFDGPGKEVLSFLLEGLQPRTWCLYRKEFGRLRSAIPPSTPWPELAVDTQDNLLRQYLVKGYEAAPSSADSLPRAQAGYLVSYLRYADACNKHPVAHRVCGIWRHRSPPVPAWPATPEIPGAIAGGMELQRECRRQCAHT